MKYNILKISSLIAIFLLSLVSCVGDETYENKSTIKTTELFANKTVAEINTLAASATPTLYTNDDVIEAYVTSSDETGNFFSSISFQTLTALPENPIGFSVSADFKSFGWGFTPGRKVYIKLKGLYYAKVDGSLKIGALFNSNGTNSIGRIANFDWDKFLFPSATIVSENDLVRTRTVGILNNPSYLNVLTEIDNVRFADSALGRTLFDIDSGGLATNHVINEVGTNNSSTFRTSSFATMARLTVPTGQGKIRGVLSRFGSTYQFFIRNPEDLKLTNPRAINFLSSLNENFQSYASNRIIFPNYVNFLTVGTKNWRARNQEQNDPNLCLEMSAFGGTVEENKSYFLIPVNMTAASSFTFSTRIKFFTGGNPLKIYRTMDYIPGMKITDVTKIDISDNFNVPFANTNSFLNVGTYNIPASITGNGYFIFEYSGTNKTTQQAVTTTIQLDDIVIN